MKVRIASVIVAVIAPAIVFANVAPGTTSPQWRTELVYDSGSVAGGVAIDSGVINVAKYSVCSAFVDNSAGLQRLVVFIGFESDGTTKLFDGTVGTGFGGTANVPASSLGVFTVGIPSGTAGITNGSIYVLPPKMQFKLNAAGTGAARVVVYCR